MSSARPAPFILAWSSPTVGVRLGEREQHRTLRACATGGGTGLSIPSPLLSGRREALFVGTTMPGHGDSSIGVDACQTGDLGTVAHWPRVRAVLRDPNTGCSFFGDDGCDPFEDEDSLKPGYSPAFMYLFDWAQMQAEPNQQIELLDKPYLKADGNTTDTMRLRRDMLEISGGNGLSNCGNWTGRGDVLLTRLRPGKFTTPGAADPAALDVRVSGITPWDSALVDQFTTPDSSFQYPNLFVQGGAGMNVPTDRFLGRLQLDKDFEEQRRPYTMIAEMFGFPVAAGMVHTIAGDICVKMGDQCLEPSSYDDDGMPVYVVLPSAEPLELMITPPKDLHDPNQPPVKDFWTSLKYEDYKVFVKWEIIPKHCSNITWDASDSIRAQLDISKTGMYDVAVGIEKNGQMLVIDKIRAVVMVEFVNMWETKNKANRICNSILEDEPPPKISSHNLYLVSDPMDNKYHVTLEVDEGAEGCRNGLMYGVYKDEVKLPGSDGFFPESGPADIVFDEINADLTDFVIRVGYDWNENSLLDEGEIMKLSAVDYKLTEQSFDALRTEGIPDEFLTHDYLGSMMNYGFKEEENFLNAVELCIGETQAAQYIPAIVKHALVDKNNPDEPTVRGTSSEKYRKSRDFLDLVVDWGWITLPEASDLVRIFRDGTHANIPDKRRPQYIGTFSINALDSTSDFSEWLLHNSGAPFDESGTAQLSYYLWDKSTTLAKKVGTYAQIMNAVDTYYHNTVWTKEADYLMNMPVDTTIVLPFPGGFYELLDWDSCTMTDCSVPYIHESPLWVPKTSVDFDDWIPNDVGAFFQDVYSAVGRGRLITHRVQFTIRKIEGVLAPQYIVEKVRSQGVVEDLYDFNREAPGAGGKAAVVQIGHGNGSYGSEREAGIIFRDRIEFDVILELY